MEFPMVRRVDKAAIKIGATRSEVLLLCLQQYLPVLEALSKQEAFEMRMKFMRNEVLHKVEIPDPETEF
jgi:hypothetical protein